MEYDDMKFYHTEYQYVNDPKDHIRKFYFSDFESANTSVIQFKKLYGKALTFIRIVED